MRWKLLVGAAALASAAQTTAQVPTDREAALFGVRESAVGVDLSPSGRFVSYVAPSRGGGAVGFIADEQRQ